jgi:tripartite-type tricarboxylate transporter receptor subunit TctC
MKKWMTLGLMLGTALAALAQDAYPNKPVRLLVGFAAGGPTDQVARVVATELTEKFKQPFIVDNRPGGNGAIAAQAVIGGAPDGYTLLVGTSGALTVSPSILKNMPYQPLKDLTAVSMLAGFPYALVVPTELPVHDLKSLVDYVRANPGKVSYSSAGIGSVNHLAGEWFKSLAGIDISHVPYKGDAPALVDLVAGRVQMGFNTPTTAMPQVRAGKLRAIAATSEAPTNLIPGLPAMAQNGFPGFVVEPWNGILGPAGMPKDAVQKLNRAVNEILARPDVQAKVQATGQYVLLGDEDALRKRMERETAKWREVARLANVQPE